jgi:hypothetical protein
MAPSTTPMISVMTIDAQIGTPPASIMAMMVLVRPTTAPTERSMPAVMMTKVCPTAMIDHIESWRSRFSKLPKVAKLSVETDSASHSTTSSASRVRLSRKPKRCPFRAARFGAAMAAVLVSDTDGLRQNGFGMSGFRLVAGDDRATAEDMQPVAEVVDLWKVG